MITIKINKPLIHFFKRRFPCRRRPRFLRSLIVTRLLRQSFMFVNYYTFFVEYVADEVLTYEEVALLQPDPQRKRPVVLIGMLAQTASLKRSPFCLKIIAVAGSFLLLRRCNRLLISDNSSNVFYSFT